ncbi:MAG: FMN-binding protein [Coriobacteriia bacterium]|nr:FMN-binding protein [Coriobacteriia bacterium]
MSERSGTKGSPLMKVLIVIGVFLLLMVLALGAMVLATEGQRRDDRNLTIADVDFAQVPDGTYRGSYDGWNTFDVFVTVTGGAVTDITIAEDSANPRTDITDKVIELIVDGQSLDVDTVSGATVTTNALVKAVEIGLVEQREE